MFVIKPLTGIGWALLAIWFILGLSEHMQCTLNATVPYECIVTLSIAVEEMIRI
jgi:hypothetical protein